MTDPHYRTLGAPNPAALPVAIAQRLVTIARIDTLTAERDQARAERDTLRTALQVMQNERDEARALGRMA